jgi:hypothetical protein
MLAAIITRGEDAWFFKMTGPDAATAAQSESFTKLLESLRFSAAGEPEWKLPEGWSQRPGNSMRFATLVVEGAEEPLECSVSKLPFADPSRDEYVLANINRWRGQLRLSPIAISDLPGETKVVKLADEDLQATVINIVGQSSGAGSMAPFAGGNVRPSIAGGGSESSMESRAGKLRYETPVGWSPGAAETSRGGIVVRWEAAFEVRDGDQRIEITVSKFPTAAGATLPNINRWRGQIGLNAIASEQLDREKKTIELGGITGDYVNFGGSEQSILGVIAERNGLTWFVKLQGSSDLANREQQNFENFVRSIRWD